MISYEMIHLRKHFNVTNKPRKKWFEVEVKHCEQFCIAGSSCQTESWEQEWAYQSWLEASCHKRVFFFPKKKKVNFSSYTLFMGYDKGEYRISVPQNTDSNGYKPLLPIEFYCWCKFPQELNDDYLHNNNRYN